MVGSFLDPFAEYIGGLHSVVVHVGRLYTDVERDLLITHVPSSRVAIALMRPS